MNQSSFKPPPTLPIINQSNFLPPQNLPNTNQSNFLPPPNLPNTNQFNFPAPNIPSKFPTNPTPSAENMSLQRVSISEKTIVSANNDGRFNSILISNPGVQLFSASAGDDQTYINVVGPYSSVNRAAKTIESLEPNQDERWYYLNDKGKFKEYSVHLNELIEKSFKKGESNICFTGSNNKNYIILFGEHYWPHQQIVEGIDVDRTVYRTIRRGALPKNLNCIEDIETPWYWADEIMNEWRKYEPEASLMISYHYEKFKAKFRNDVLRVLGC